jgi:hypothetical protein
MSAGALVSQCADDNTFYLASNLRRTIRALMSSNTANFELAGFN